MTLVPILFNPMSTFLQFMISLTHWNRYCFNMVMAVTTLGLRPVDRACNSMLLEIIAVVNSVSAAVPAPQQRMFSVI